MISRGRRVSKGKRTFDQELLFPPESNWEPPTELPDLFHEKEVSIDTETRDDSLARGKGPGFYLYERSNPNTGFISGISVAWRDQAVYIPLRHPNTQCFEYDLVRRWLRALSRQTHTRFAFHNFQYDWGWIEAVFDIPPPDNIDDTAALASMLDENLPEFNLDYLLRWQGLPGKDETLLRELMTMRGITKDKDVKANLWRLEGKYVGPYAEQDAFGTLGLSIELRPQLAEENLENAYQIERDLMPITLKMKQRGIRVNTDRAEHLSKQILGRCDELLFQLSKDVQQKVTIKEIRSNRWLRDMFDEMGLYYPRTEPTEQYTEGQASFEKSFMSSHQHWFPRAVFKIKHQTDLAEKFLKSFILGYAHKGRVYPTVNQFRNEGGGARSHRFSYSDPALQQMPSRDDEWAPLIRSCFIPEDGEEWCSIDYRQQEYRLIVFVAELLRAKGAKAAADRYRTDPNTDFHDYVALITRLQRRRAKDVNFAKSYGAGVKKFALMTGMSEEESEQVMKQYDDELPFVREAADVYTRYAREHGFIKMIDGARNHFNLWEPIYRDYAREAEYRKTKMKLLGINTLPCLEEEVNARKNNPEHPWYGERMRRAFTHKAFNRMIQGSAARQIKKAMVDLSRAGYIALLQLHDELGFSFGDRKHGKECAKIMEEACPIITIPMTTDVEFGPSWGEVEK